MRTEACSIRKKGRVGGCFGCLCERTRRYNLSRAKTQTALTSTKGNLDKKKRLQKMVIYSVLSCRNSSNNINRECTLPNGTPSPLTVPTSTPNLSFNLLPPHLSFLKLVPPSNCGCSVQKNYARPTTAKLLLTYHLLFQESESETQQLLLLQPADMHARPEGSAARTWRKSSQHLPA